MKKESEEHTKRLEEEIKNYYPDTYKQLYKHKYNKAIERDASVNSMDTIDLKNTTRSVVMEAMADIGNPRRTRERLVTTSTRTTPHSTGFFHTHKYGSGWSAWASGDPYTWQGDLVGGCSLSRVDARSTTLAENWAQCVRSMGFNNGPLTILRA